MSRDIIEKILNTLNLIEIKGYQNINYMCGVMTALQNELSNNGGDNNGVQSNNMGK